MIEVTLDNREAVSVPSSSLGVGERVPAWLSAPQASGALLAGSKRALESPQVHFDSRTCKMPCWHALMDEHQAFVKYISSAQTSAVSA